MAAIQDALSEATTSASSKSSSTESGKQKTAKEWIKRRRQLLALLIDLLPAMMTSFSRSFPNANELREVAEVWADDLLEIPPDRLKECFRLAKSHHASLSGEAIRFPLASTEVLAAWREQLARERIDDLMTSHRCNACKDTGFLSYYSPAEDIDKKAPCPFHDFEVKR